MKLQIENNSPSDLIANSELVSDISSQNGSAEVTEMLRAGIKAAQEGNRAEARNLLMQATEIEPNNESAWLWLASISEYPEELLIFLSNVLSINPANTRALEWEKSTKSLLSKTFVQRGIDASKEAQNAAAKQSFLQAIVHDDKNEMAWLWLASMSAAIEEKKAHLQKVLSINPKNETALESLKSVKNEMAKVLLQKARTAAVTDDREAADKMLKEILSHAPELADAWLLKSFLTDSFSEKAGCFEKILSIDPDHQTAAQCLAAMQTVLEHTTPDDQPVQAAAEAEQTEQADQTEEDMLDLHQPVEENPPVEAVEAAEPIPADAEAVAETAEEAAEEMAEETAEEAAEEMAEEMAEETVEEMVVAAVPAEAESVEFEAERYYTNEEIAEFPTVEFSTAEDEPVADELLEAEDANADPSEKIIEDLEEYFDAPEYLPESVDDEEAEMNVAFAANEDEDFAAEVPEKTEAVAGDAAESPAEQHREEPVAETAPKAELVSCVFCEAQNEPQDFICQTCHAMLTLSDLEMLLAHPNADRDLLERAIERMEIEKSHGDFDAEDLKQLGIAHINLKNLRQGFKYLQEAAHLNPNDMLLNSQVNSLAIRLSEIEEKQNIPDTMPKNKTILVVDDSATVRKLISGKLEKCGHEVICAVDGMDALEKINAEIPDLILLDITMPRMDGYQVCKLIRGNEATKEVPVVMISGKDGFFDKVRGRMAGTTGYITKPFGPETLMKTVETYIN